MRVIKKIEVREFNYGYGVVTQNFLMNYSLFKIFVKPSRKVQFSSEKQKDMSDDGTRELPGVKCPAMQDCNC